MTQWKDATAIVTGAASGIGLALSRALVARGAEVWLTDVDAGAAKAAAESLGARAHAEALDVRDAAAFRERVESVVSERGRLDFLFNNAGIGIAAEAHEFSTEHYDRTIDVNIRGVTNGVAAAYPGMVAQGRGHIVNTASAAGLVPAPLFSAYSMSKHAVVGLTRSLRIEAARFGVRVSALCPTTIETPLLDAPTPGDLPQVWRPDLRHYLTRLSGAPVPADRFAEYALDQVARGRGLVVAPLRARVGTFLYRLAPGLGNLAMRRAFAEALAGRPRR